MPNRTLSPLITGQSVNPIVFPTYAYRGADISSAQLGTGSVTDALSLRAATNKNRAITRVGFSGKATAAALIDLYLTKRTTANSGGSTTSVLANATKYDSLDPAPDSTGDLVLYSAAATSLGTGTGLEGDIVYLPAAASPAGEPTHWQVTYGDIMAGAKPPVLRAGTNESFAIGFGGATLNTSVPGFTFYLYLEWIEFDSF